MTLRARLLSCVALLILATPAPAVTVSYAANLGTSKGNPVTHLLILESDGIHPVQASVHPAQVPGGGTVLIAHDAAVRPTRSLVIGLTEGRDVDGSDKTQLVMLLDPAFAAARVGVPFSGVFPGARHSDTIARLIAAATGDAAQLAWFADTFFSGPAAGAAFETGGDFVVAEFTGLKIIGQNATAGSWMITDFRSVPHSSPDAQDGKTTALIEETAKRDLGPFDIELSLNFGGVFAVEKSVLNDTGVAWTRFVLELGTGTGAGFVPSLPGDGLGFDDGLDNRDASGAFPNVAVQEDRIVFTGLLPPGATARFVVFVETDTPPPHLVTVRQRAAAALTGAPLLGAPSLAVFALGLGALAALRLRRRPLGRG